ncbi:hypothetical protein K7432_007571 [Basidiobolus ranarum]|uniref:Uncharacterized protein n=1 Tax=Basidiobolus ranarum TaxID=34480 RepID=A0ABR2VZW0_9FUNG
MLTPCCFLAVIAILMHTISAIPVRYFDYGDQPCTLQFSPCAQHYHPQLMYSEGESQYNRFPVMKQVFTTITRKHSNLNTAKASRKHSMNVKYQSGPSVEAEGEQTAAAYGKKYAMEEPMGLGTNRVYREFPGMMQRKYMTSWKRPTISDMSKQFDHNELVNMPTMEQDEERPVTFVKPGTYQTEEAESSDMPMMEKTEEYPVGENWESALGQTKDAHQEYPQSYTPSGTFNMELSNLKPRQALLDRVNAFSSRGSQALSNSNQFDQAQILDQTLYQYPQPQSPQIVIPYWAMHNFARPCRDYHQYGRCYFEPRYFSGYEDY